MNLDKLLDRIIDHAVNKGTLISNVDVEACVRGMVPALWESSSPMLFGVSEHHPVHFHFRDASLCGSYIMGRCRVSNAIVFKSDIRGDELKDKGQLYEAYGKSVSRDHDELIRIKNSFMNRSVVHGHVHDPDGPGEFLIQGTLSGPCANIHGSPVDRCFLGPFSTVDQTSLKNCTIGTYAYIQTQTLGNAHMDPGHIRIEVEDHYEFNYRYALDILEQYIALEPYGRTTGVLMDFVTIYEEEFEGLEKSVMLQLSPRMYLPGTSVHPFCVQKGENSFDENVHISQRVYLANASIGKGSSIQENCHVMNSRLEGLDVVSHGAKITNAHLGKRVFTGFNSLLWGKSDCALNIGKNTIIMPHTIIDLKQPIDIPGDHLVWGYIRNQKDLEENSVSLEKLKSIDDEICIGGMEFKGSGEAFIQGLTDRFQKSLEMNGGLFDGVDNMGHAQKGRDFSINIIQPYLTGRNKGVFPYVDILS